MPSPETAADLERVLLRAAEECETEEGIWFGEGLPQSLRKAIEARGRATGRTPPHIAFIEVGAPTQDLPPRSECRVVGLSTSGLEALPQLIELASSKGAAVARLICADAVFDFTALGVRVREIRHGLTAADLQQRLSFPLWSGPDLKELGSH